MNYAFDAKGRPIDPWHPQNSGGPIPQRQSYSIPHYVLPTNIPTHIVCGAPASGKTTYVRQHKQPGDLVIDLDDIRESLGGDRYSDDYAVVRRAFNVRDDLIRGLAHQQTGAAWLVVCTGSLAEQRAWLAALGGKARLHEMTTPKDECHRRVDLDSARKNVRRILHERIDAYFRSM